MVGADGRLESRPARRNRFPGRPSAGLERHCASGGDCGAAALDGRTFCRDPAAVAVLESALIFEVVRDARARGEKEGVLADWRRRIDRIIVVTAPDELKIARYAARISPSLRRPRRSRGRCAQSPGPSDSRRRKSRTGRLSCSITPETWPRCAAQVAALWLRLPEAESNKIPALRSLQ